MAPQQMREGDWICPQCSNHNYADKVNCNRCGIPNAMGTMGATPIFKNGHSPKDMRPGDWMCPSCNNHNYADKTSCNRCGLPKPVAGLDPGIKVAASYGSYGAAMPQARLTTLPPRVSPYGNRAAGNWTCSACSNVNYPLRTKCNRCGLPKEQAAQPGAQQIQVVPTMVRRPSTGPGAGAAAGGWTCPACSNYNFAMRSNCNRCGIPKETRLSKAGLREGDWFCLACANHNYADKFKCNKCGIPKEQATTPPPKKMEGGFAQDFRDGDWICTACTNHNYASRTVCNKCKAEKPV